MRRIGMSVEEYAAAMVLAADAADRALGLRDMETHMLWARTFHRLATACLAEHGVELRPPC